MLKGFSDWITAVIDFFYPPFRRFIPIQTFRYLACGGGNTLFDIIIFYLSYHYLFDQQVLHTGIFLGSREIAFQPYTLAVMTAFCISFPTGFFLMRSVVFHDSDLRGRVQLFRYLVQVAICLLLNFLFIKIFVEQFHIYPTPAKILTTVLVVTFSYLSQRYFTFRKSTS
ncbi:MAG: GtrA family protein [Bacteroidetes bacterium]|nr:GtrA family protein [Bacteroidota bacterium]